LVNLVLDAGEEAMTCLIFVADGKWNHIRVALRVYNGVKVKVYNDCVSLSSGDFDEI